MEWGIRSYQSFVLGSAFLLFAATATTAPISKPVSYLMALSGLAYLAQGWIIGSQVFSSANTLPTLLGFVSTTLWSLWFSSAPYR